MCCFSGPVRDVSATKIFARLEPAAEGAPARQVIAYAMELTAAQDVAMVLPLPTPADSADDAVRFVNLEGYPELFDRLFAAFPRPQSRGGTLGPDAVAKGERAPLEVHAVGAFEASFVPRRADFARLDARFRLPEQAWDGLPGYATYGFAVFKLKAGERKKVHPMAFSFPTRYPARLFFPTVHVHDGTAPAQARFDHTLYWQVAPEQEVEGEEQARWQESPGTADAHVDTKKAQGLVRGDWHLHMHAIVGRRPNRDVLLRVK